MKKVCLFLLSAMLTVMLAFGLVACGNNSKKPDDNNPGGVVTPPDDKDPDNPDDKDPEKPTKPVIKLDKDSITLIIGEDVVVTATVTGSDKAPSFSLGGTTVAAIQTETNAKSATIKGLAGGDDTLTVQLEGADAVTVPVKVENVDYRFNADFDEDEKIFDAGVTGEDDGETATISVTHFIENAKIEYSVEGAAATVTASEDGKTATVKAEQAGVAKVTAKILAVKENAEEGGEQPQDGETEPTVEYEEHAVKIYTVVCTDDWNDLAEESLIGTELLEYREVKNGTTVVGYEAFISSNASASDIMDEGDVKGVLRIPAIHNRLPVVSIGKNPQDIATLYFLAYEKPLTDDQIAAIEDETEKANAQAYKAKVEANKDAVDAMQSVYAAVKTVYLPCTITSIPDLTFRLATAEEIKFQEGSNITKLGVQSFNQMVNLARINLEVLTKLTVIDECAFDNSGPTKEWSITLPAGSYDIMGGAFANSGLKELRFEDDNDPETGVVIHCGITKIGKPNAFYTVFMNSKLEKLWLNNIKECKNNAFWLTGTLKEIHIGASVLTSNLGVDNFGATASYSAFAGFGFTGTAWNAVDIYLEGNSDVAKNVAKLGNNGYEVGLGDNCGGLFGFATNVGLHNVYISTETKTSDVSGYLANFFKRADAQDKEGYVKYSWKKFNWEYKDPTDTTKGVQGVAYDESAKFVDPEESENQAA